MLFADVQNNVSFPNDARIIECIGLGELSSVERRAQQILALLGKGLAVQQVVDEVGCTPKTVRNVRNRQQEKAEA